MLIYTDRWHWRAFLTGGGSAFWLLAYGLFYWASRLSLDSFSGVVLYLGYLFLLVVLDFLVTGKLSYPRGSVQLLMRFRLNWLHCYLLGNAETLWVDTYRLRLILNYSINAPFVRI